ncbi:MAG: restriction endonuclease subunit S [Paeniclostridium sordellii]|nr:restriction endonuclease subunit S [Paeniclostridium sordellii]
MKYRYREDIEMKDSGIEWIGKIPKDWEVKKNKYMISEINLRNSYNNENLLSVSEYYGVALRKDKMSEDEFLTRAESLEGYKICKKDDLVMNIMLAWKKAMGVSEYDGIVSPAYCIYRKKDDIFMKYYHYLFRTDLYAKVFKQNSTGIIDSRLRLYPEKFLGLYSHRPNLENQEKIAKFLDKKTSQFDHIISKKEDLIQKLGEAKQSFISEIVTGKVKVVKTDDGYELVNRHGGEMKDSGVEWLGEIPKEWKISKIKYNCDINKLTLREDTEDDYEIKYIDIGSVNSDGEIEDMQLFKFKDAPSRARRIIKDRDILISTVRTYLKAITSIDKIEDNIICSTGFAVLTPMESLDYKFLSYFVRGNLFIDEIVSRSKGVSYPSITPGEIGNLEIILPGKLEQAIIGEFISIKINYTNNIIKKIKREIEKLKEAKQSLISETVTGKIEILD